MENFPIEDLWGLTTAQKLMWLYIRNKDRGRYSARQLALALEISLGTANTGLRELVEKGYVREIEEARGSRSALIEAVLPTE